MNKIIKNTGEEKRNNILDIAKGVGILSVVYCHAIEIYNDEFLFRFFYLFHMAFFFILSGYFFKEKYAFNWQCVKEFIKKRAKALLLPYLIFNIIFLFLHNFFLDIYFLPSNEVFFTEVLDTKVMLTLPIDKYTFTELLKHLFWIILLNKQEFFVGTTWFLKVLFFISSFYTIGTFFINKIQDIRKREFLKLFVCLICFAIGFYLSTKNWNFYKIGTMLSCAILFHIGVIHKNIEHILPRKINYYIVFLIATIFLCIINTFNPKFFYISHNWYNNPVWFLLASIIGYIWMLQLSTIINKINILAIIFSYIGKHTISILCLHLLFFKLTILLQIFLWQKPIQMLQAYETYYTSYLWGLVYTLISVTFSILSLILFNKLIKKIDIKNIIKILKNKT